MLVFYFSSRVRVQGLNLNRVEFSPKHLDISKGAPLRLPRPLTLFQLSVMLNWVNLFEPAEHRQFE